jgi:hypothetical protein
MALADWDAYQLAKMNRVIAGIGPFTVGAKQRRPAILWTGTPGSPTALGITDQQLAIPQEVFIDSGTATKYLTTVDLQLRTSVPDGMSGLWIIDKLNHQGGLSGTDTSAPNTTNFPTSSLTRYTDGVGVMIGITVNGQIGVTSQTITCSYTNQSGTSGRTSQPVQIGGTNFREANVVIMPDLQSGDYGVRSVESSTLSGSTGTVGSFGFFLFKPLALIPCVPGLMTSWDAVLGGGGNIVEIKDDCCLTAIIWNGSNQTTNTTGPIGTMGFIEA